MTKNIDHYRELLADLQLPRDEETALIEALISVAECFADLAFGRHPAQHPDVASKDSASVFNVVNLGDSADNDNEQESDADRQAS